MNGSFIGYDGFLQGLQHLGRGYWGLAQDEQQRIQALLAQLQQYAVTVTFGGHFSSGKSTLINAILDRSLLPVMDLPETGAICALCRGNRNSAEVITNQGRRSIDCTTAAIAQEVSLRTSAGLQPATALLQIKQLNIMLATDVIPPGVIWIDSPGINESSEMHERAIQASRRCDALIWVLNSRQFLSISEEAFLTEFIAERGPRAVYFVANAFLNRDTLEAWNTYHTNSFPAHLKKLDYRAPFMGFSDRVKPQVISVSARALCTYKGDLFGGRELQALLKSLSRHDLPRIRRVRLFRAAFLLHEIAARTEQQLAQERERIRQEQSHNERREQEIQRQKSRFTSAVESALAQFFVDWRSGARSCETRVVATLDSSNLSSVTRSFSTQLTSAALQAATPLLKTLENLCQQHNRRALTEKNRDQLKQLLSPSAVTVIVANNDLQATPGGAGAVMGAAVGTALMPGVGTLVGALVGGVAGLFASGNSAVQKDVADTAANVRSATQQAINSLENKRADIQAFILEQCSSRQQRIAPPDTAKERLLARQHQILTELAHQAEEMGGTF